MPGVGIIAIEVVIVSVGGGGHSAVVVHHHTTIAIIGVLVIVIGRVSFECLTLGDARRGKAKPLRITLIDEDRKPDKGFSW